MFKFSVMNAIIKISATEFNEALFKKLSAILSHQNMEITITICDKSNQAPEDRAFWKELDKAIEDIKSGKGEIYTLKELENMIQN